MELYIIRHGETAHNKSGMIQGHFDVKLNSVGVKQAKLLAKRLTAVNFDYIYSSDLSRARRTTEEILKYQKCKVKYTKALRERNFGHFTNRKGEEYLEFIKQKNILDTSRKLPLGVETVYKMNERVVNLFEKIFKKRKDETILFSTHIGVNIILWMYFNKIPIEKFSYEKKFGNTSVTIIRCYENKKHEIVLENCTKHIAPRKANNYLEV
jgi:broad specificity phosphatase PhoE